MQRKDPYSDIATETVEQAQQLKRLTTYVVNQSHIVGTGRAFNADICLIYWPDIDVNSRCSSHIASKTGCPKPPESTRSFSRFLRQHVEDLLGPLVVPVGEYHFDLYANSQGLVDADPAYRALTDPMNYTAFVRLRQDRHAFVRALLTPPLEGRVRPWMKELPDAVTLLFHAWTMLVQRNAVDPFASSDRGISFLSDGRLFVHWQRFLESGHCPLRSKDLHPDIIYKTLMQLKRPFSINKGVIARNLGAPKNTLRGLDPNSPRSLNDYQKALRASGMCATPTSLKSFCTVVDPIFLYRKEKLFDGRAYYQHRQRTKKSFIMSQERRRVGAPPLRPAKLHTFEFKPSLYLDEPPKLKELADVHQWFDPEHTETVYAIRRSKQLLFARPALISAKNPACRGDLEAWLRAMDSLRQITTFEETGQIESVAAMSRSEYYKALTAEHMETTAAAHIEDFISGDKVSGRKMKAALRRAEAEEHRRNPELSTSTAYAKNWYNRMVVEAAKQFVDEGSVRRVAMVQLPYKEDIANVTFFTPAALRTFEKFGLGSFGVIDVAYESTPLAPLFSSRAIPAPYLLAWARFCLDVQKRDVIACAPGEESVSRWTPAEDLILFTRYHSRPRMKPAEWKELLSMLPARSKQTCATRINLLNKTLRQVLFPQQLAAQKAGDKACDPVAALRSVLIVGATKRAKSRGIRLNKHTTFARDIMALDDSYFDKLHFPETYRAAMFNGFFG